MKLLRYGPSGAERPGLLDDRGIIRDLSAVVTDIDPTTLTPSMLARLASLAVDDLPKVDDECSFSTGVMFELSGGRPTC